MGKGSKPRPRQITREEESLRTDFFFGKICRATYSRKYATLKRRGLIRRSGRVIK